MTPTPAPAPLPPIFHPPAAACAARQGRLVGMNDNPVQDPSPSAAERRAWMRLTALLVALALAVGFGVGYHYMTVKDVYVAGVGIVTMMLGNAHAMLLGVRR